jgi:hypothetical protein
LNRSSGRKIQGDRRQKTGDRRETGDRRQKTEDEAR